MLVLTRKQGQRLLLTTGSGEVIEVTIKKSTSTKAVVSIEAPETVRVLRAELAELDATA